MVFRMLGVCVVLSCRGGTVLFLRGGEGAVWKILGLADQQKEIQLCLAWLTGQIRVRFLTCMRLAAQQLHFKGDPLVPLQGTYSDKACFNWRNKVVPHFLEIVGVALENLLQRHKDTMPWQKRTFGLRPRSILFTPNQCASR